MEPSSTASTPPPTVDSSSALEAVSTALSRTRVLAEQHTLTLHNHATAIQVTEEPAPTPNSKQKSSARSRSSDAATTHTPGSVTAGLSYYKELFSKLRFSYLETITKEKYLRSILEDPPAVTESHENEALELELSEYKQDLAEMKSDMVLLVTQIELLSEKLGVISPDAASKLAELEGLPDELAELDNAIQTELSNLGKSPSQEPHDETLHLPLNETLALVHRLESELSSIDRDLTSLTNIEVPRKQRLTEQLDKELKPLEMDKAGLVGLATQAKHMREREREMGRADRENMGRWYKAANEAMSQLVGPEPL
ncbi:hypothetical protein DFH27DRAFT_48264 [Peziza echinospora]|nr:hypothetical protein DFH27DRAFT_48264 [Peziza echinospora]